MSMMDQYLEAFLTDTHASLENIRAALVCIEKEQTNHEAIYEAMRLFHSLKSSSAMMGFQPISIICHAQEETFRTLEQGKGPCTPDIQQRAVIAVNEIVDFLQQIEEKGPDSLRGTL
jgi:two-component system chemotaxis sensor kinase CheA